MYLNTYRRYLAAFALAGPLAAGAATPADVQATFHPYDDAPPRVEGLNPGMTIDQGNVERFAGLLDPATLQSIREGWYRIEVGETTSFAPHPDYEALTLEHLGEARLGDKNGVIEGYRGGLPFPAAPDADDPRAGEKLAWNFKYSFGTGDAGVYAPFYYILRDMETGNTERTIKFGYYLQKHDFRVVQEPVPALTPNPSGIFRSFYLRVFEPDDIRDTQLLIQRYLDDTQLDDAYLYLGFQRRVRRLATGQTTDAFLGTDIMIEDFEGYNARISDMQWRYVETKTTLAPMYNHNDQELGKADEDGDYRFIATGGQGNCYMDVTWQLRTTHVLEATPVDPSHALGKRVLYLDAQTYTIPVSNMYDRNQKLWKAHLVGFSHPDHHLPENKGSGVPLFDGVSMIDFQARHCTVGLIRGTVQQPPPEIFTTQYMRGAD
ncbi:DUF1329 domain-containing protein [Algiphilus sp.]|uniref:DUF1329 domain-containing protein n=1 Tax=Algiphilus sp. TaxID=1872431 RepID=UPI003BAB8CD7